jgi:hypothetical protein
VHTHHYGNYEQQSEAGGPATMKVSHIASFPDDRVRWTRNPYYSPKFRRSDDTFAPEPVKLSLC